MGMPACTITSQTAHGGIVTVGYPTVLINFMPASRIGDLHVCPMVTGVVPHVGGPFILGSPTVLVGMMPQSRVTDQLVCVGPPDVAVMGAETVLVGMAGAGGVVSMSAGLQSMGVPVPMQPPPSSAAAVQASMQPDGTVATSAAQGTSLPPIPLQHAGFPELPPEVTATFESVQPATIPQGTTLYAPCGADQSAAGNYWATTPPAATVEGAYQSAKDAVAALQVTDPAGMKAWVGKAADQGQQQAQQALQQAQKQLQQAQQEAQNAAQQVQQAGQQAQEQAQQAAQSAAQQGQQAVQQAQQQLQQAQQAAQSAATQAQQMAQQTVQQAHQQVQQAQQAAQQAATQTSSKLQVWTSQANAAAQAVQKFARPGGF